MTNEPSTAVHTVLLWERVVGELLRELVILQLGLHEQGIGSGLGGHDSFLWNCPAPACISAYAARATITKAVHAALVKARRGASS